MAFSASKQPISNRAREPFHHIHATDPKIDPLGNFSFSFPQSGTELGLNFVFSLDEFIFFSAANFVLCCFITMITIVVVSIGDVAYGSHWYSMQHDDQFLAQMIVTRSQKPFALKGLSVFVCSLETYAKVNGIDHFVWLMFHSEIGLIGEHLPIFHGSKLCIWPDVLVLI